MIFTRKRLWAGAALIAAVMATITFAARVNASPAPACHFAGPSAQMLVTVVNTRDTEVHCLGLDVDADRNITDLRIESHKRGDDAQGDTRLKRYSLAAIGTDYGAVLDGRPGHDALILQGRIAKGASQAKLVIRYLYNGITGEFRSCKVRLHKKADGDWMLINARDRVVSRIVVKTWKIPIVGTVGIDTLEGACIV